MIIQEQMDVKKFSFVLVLVILVSALTTRSSGGRRGAEDAIIDINEASLQIDEVMVEKLLINCRLHLMHMQEAVENFNFCLPDELDIGSKTSGSTEQVSAMQKLQKAINHLPPQMKQTLFECLKKHNLGYHVSAEEDNSKSWYIEYLKSVLKWPAASRRYLAADSFEIAAGAHHPPPPARAIHPPHNKIPIKPLSPPNRQPPAIYQNKNEESGMKHSHEKPHKHGHPSKKKNKQTSVAVAVSVTAAVTFSFASLLFCCYQKCRKRGSGNGSKDESPLLTLSLSSSQKSSSLSSPIKKAKLGNLSYSNPNRSERPSSWDSSFSAESDILNYSPTDSPLSGPTSGNAGPALGSPFPPLKPPPGRTILTGSPPRPPPGKAVPTPPAKGVPSPLGPQPPKPPPPAPLPPGPPPPPPKAAGSKPGPRAPPPPKSNAPSIKNKVPQPPPQRGTEDENDAPKTKLKPFFWDKVLASPDHSMVWHQINSGSFQFNEEMIESLFGCSAAEKNKNERKKELASRDPSMQFIQIIEAKKAQNLSILLRALNVTTIEVHDALNEGSGLPVELLQTLLKMAPTSDEELKLRLFSGDLSQLGPAERFLKVLVDIPFAFKRLESLLLMSSLQEEVSGIKESLETLEIACTELRNSRLFLKLLEAVLKTGNRMNDGTFRGRATAFKLDTLLKLSDVKGTDGKTTLLHFVVQEIIRSEGARAIRLSRESLSFSSVKSEDLMEDVSPVSVEQHRSRGLQVVSSLSGELENVKKAALLDADGITNTVSTLGNALLRSRDFLNKELKGLNEESGFFRKLTNFVNFAESEISLLLEEEKRVMALVKSTADYFHGNAGKDEGLRLFLIVRDFLIMLDKACKEVRESANRPARPLGLLQNKDTPTPRLPPSPDLQQRFFPPNMERRMDSSSSDDD